MGKKFGFSFSMKRAIGISGLKNKISKKTKFPLTQSGRQRKVGRKMGCSIVLLILLFIFFSIIAFAIWIF